MANMKELGHFLGRNAKGIALGTALAAGSAGGGYEVLVRQGQGIAPIIKQIEEFSTRREGEVPDPSCEPNEVPGRFVHFVLPF